jgi:chromate transporter
MYKHTLNSYLFKKFTVGAVVIIGLRSITDISTSLIAITSLVVLLYFKKIQEPYVIAIAALIGLALKLFF